MSRFFVNRYGVTSHILLRTNMFLTSEKMGVKF